MQLNWRPDSPAIPYAWLFAPVRFSMAMWVGGHVPKGGGQLAGEHTLPALHWYKHSRDPRYCQHAQQRGSERGAGIDAAYPLVTRVYHVLKGASALCPSFYTPHLLF